MEDSINNYIIPYYSRIKQDIGMIKSLFTLKGRARRSEWWKVCIGISLLCYAMNFILEGEPSFALSLTVLILSLSLFWMGIAINTRRCHDLGHNGFWQFIPFYVIWLGFVKGTSGANEYGPDPTEDVD